MINIDHNTPLYISFKLEPTDYSDVPVSSAYFSSASLKRTETIMRRLNFEPTIEMLLKRTPSELMKQRGFGNRALKDILSLCEELRNNNIDIVGIKLAAKDNALVDIIKNRDQILNGNFSSLLDTDVKGKYEEAYEVLKDDVLPPVLSSNEFSKVHMYVTAISNSLEEQMNRCKLIRGLINSIPEERKSKDLKQYLYIYSRSKKVRIALAKEIGPRFSEVGEKRIYDICKKVETYNLVLPFILWMSRSLLKEFTDYYNEVNSNAIDRRIIKDRVSGTRYQDIAFNLEQTKQAVMKHHRSFLKRYYSNDKAKELLEKLSADYQLNKRIPEKEIKKTFGEKAHLFEYIYAHSCSEYITYDKKDKAIIFR